MGERAAARLHRAIKMRVTFAQPRQPVVVDFHPENPSAGWREAVGMAFGRWMKDDGRLSAVALLMFRRLSMTSVHHQSKIGSRVLMRRECRVRAVHRF